MSTRPFRRVIVTLTLAPLTFLAAIVGFSIALGSDAGGDSAVIAERLSDSVPQLLLTGQLLLVGLLGWVIRRDRLRPRDLGWHRPPSGRLAADLGLGVAVGGALAAAYFLLLAPVLDRLQRATGDIVPPGELLSSFRTGLVAFFVANVVLAPLVEETLYRGYALPRLREKWSPVTAVALSSAAFGILHWSGGLWYIAATALLAGVPFALLTQWRGSIVAAFAAHLTLNTIEFVAVALG